VLFDVLGCRDVREVGGGVDSRFEVGVFSRCHLGVLWAELVRYVQDLEFGFYSILRPPGCIL